MKQEIQGYWLDPCQLKRLSRLVDDLHRPEVLTGDRRRDLENFASLLLSEIASQTIYEDEEAA